MNLTNLVKSEDTKFQDDTSVQKARKTPKYDLNWLEVSPNIFYIQDAVEGTKIIYSPLHGKFFDVNNEGDSIINDYIIQNKPTNHPFYEILEGRGLLDKIDLPKIDSVIKPFNPTNITLSLTSACNLRCTYCYANAGFETNNLSWNTIRTAIDTFITYTKCAGEDHISVAFHGGGEPTILWKRLVATVEYVLETIPDKWEAGFALVTNGTLISEDKAKWLASHKFKLTVSIDGIEDVQNLQRPKANGTGSYCDLVRGINELVRAGVDFSLRSTITGANQHQLVEFIRLAHVLGCKDVSVVPFSATGRGQNGIDPVDADMFLRNYILADKEAKQLGIDFSTVSDTVESISARFCGADGNNFAIMPDGSISSCTRVTRSTDTLADVFVFGHWDNNGIFIDVEKVQKLRNLHLYSYAKCSNCFARFTCSGGCHHERFSTGTPVMSLTHCTIVQNIVWYRLLSILEIEMG